MRVVVDAFGTDRAPGPELAGALLAVRDPRAAPGQPALEVVLVGDVARLEAGLAQAGRTPADPIRLVHAREVVTMDDHPGQVFRHKPESSMRLAVAEVAAGRADAVVSAGNSGAMLACALFGLGRLPGVERPAIVTVLPTPTGPLVLCDAGANVEPKPAQLAQFALLCKAREVSRSAFRRAVAPKVLCLEEVRFEENELRDYIRALGLGDLFNQPMLKLLHQFEEAKNFGSLIQPCLDERAIGRLRQRGARVTVTRAAHATS